VPRASVLATRLVRRVAVLRALMRQLGCPVLELRRAHGQIDHGRKWIAFLIDKLVRNSLQLRVAVSCSAPSHYIASSRIDDRVAHHAQHVVERHFPSLRTFIALKRGLGLRNFILDVTAEGARQKTIHLLLVADIAPLRKQLGEHRLRTGESISITSYIAKCFASAIENDKCIQSRRLGRSRLIAFDDVDLAFLMEREWEGETITVFYIVRAAHRKTALEIHHELQAAKAAPLGADGPMNALEMQFFLLPRVIRKALWFFIRHIPYLFKDVIGTAAVTSMGMFTEGAAVVFPITPCLMLSIGSIEKRLALQDGEVVERDFIHLNISVDHAIIDGAPLVRFGEQFKKILASGVISTPAMAA